MTTVTDAPAPVVVGRTERRSERFAARRTLWKESSLARVRHCGNSMSKHGGSDSETWQDSHKAGKTVAVKLSDGVAGFAGLQTCGSPWSCPVCSQKIATVRADDVQTAVTKWHSYGGRVAFLTLTMRHKKGQRLNTLWPALSHAWGKVTSGRGWKNDAALYGEILPRTVKSGARKGETVFENRIHYVRAVEVTHGKNGWHVHIHALLFLREGIQDEEVRMLSDSVYARWANALVSQGLTSPTPENGVDIKLVRRGDSQALGDYFTKSVYVGRVGSEGAGWEVVGGAGKTARGKNRTPFQILADVVADGDADDLGLWWEFEKASKGKRQLTWSVGLRDLFSMGEEKTDEEISEDDLGGDVVMTFEAAEWRVIRWRSCEVLALAEMGCNKQQTLMLMGIDFADKEKTL